MLREIKKPNRDHARRVLQCLVAAIRPLRVEELAEVLAVDFDDAGGVPKLKPNWRWEDQEQALLISCSSLITIVDTGDSRVVQFSHFSVKEFLTSARLATSSQDVSPYHVAFKPAHTILAQACVSVLLQLPDRDEEDDVEKNGPLAFYAAEYWVWHAQYEDVALQIKGMEYLFDPDKPYFDAWRELHDIDIDSPDSVFYGFTSRESAGTPLYYAARCGFRNIVEQLIVKHPKHVQAIGGWYMTPAVAALAGRHFELAQILCREGSSVNLRSVKKNFPLHSAIVRIGLSMAVPVIVDCGVDLRPRNLWGTTPLGYALMETPARPRPSDPEVVRWLLKHGADPNVRDENGEPLLHLALAFGRTEMACLLIEHGASVKVKDRWGRTPLDYVTGEQRDELIKLYRAKRENCCIM